MSPAPGRRRQAGELTAGQSHEFAIQIPADALPTFSSAHGELYWEVEARSDEFGIDTKESRVIDVTVERAAQPTTS